MFRPSPEQTRFGPIPVRLILSIILIFAVVLTVLLVLGIEREKNVVEGLVKAQELSQRDRLIFFQSREDLIFVTIILFLVSGIAVSVVVTYQSYHAARKTLERVKSLARSILYSLPNGVLTIDRKGSVSAVNPLAEKILRVRADEILGKPFGSVFPEPSPIRAILQSAFERGDHAKDRDFVFPAGAEPAETIRVSTSALKDIDQESAGVVMLLKDISELIHLEQQLRRSDKLSALHTLSAGVAHEIRNPLSALDLNLHLLQEEVRQERSPTPEVERYFQVLNAEIQRLKGILDNFMRFAKPSLGPLQGVRIHDMLVRIGRFMKYEADERHVAIQCDPASEIPPLLGDETQLSQAFLNIVINALQSMPNGGVLRIGARKLDEEPRPAVEVAISDTGPGIRKEELERLFEPFYTTRKDGSGLGLAIAYRIIEDHRGSIRVRSTVGAGTTFLIRLPLGTAGERSARVPA
jgi:PAS domain S-box-containing protein